MKIIIWLLIREKLWVSKSIPSFTESESFQASNPFFYQNIVHYDSHLSAQFIWIGISYKSKTVRYECFVKRGTR